MENKLSEYMDNIDRTKTNKKCKRLSDAVKDKNAYLYSEALHLIKINWKADLKGLDLG